MSVKLGELFYEIALKGKDKFKGELKDTEKSTDTSSDKMVSAFKKIGAGIATYFTIDAIKRFGQEIVNVTSEVAAESSAFEQIMGDYTDNAKDKMGDLADETGMVSSRLTPHMTSMTAKFKGLGYEIDDATSLATDGLHLASDAAAFWDKSLNESVGHLNSFINGSYEGGEAIGLFANDTQMAQFAIQEGLVTSTAEWSKLDEATKQATRLEYAQMMYEQSGATGQAARESGQYANVQANLTEKWRQFKAQIGEPILQNIVIPTMGKLSGAVDVVSGAVKNLTDFYQKNKAWIDLLAATVGGFVIGLGSYKLALVAADSWQKLVTASQKLWNAAQSASPHMWLISGIMAIGGAFTYLWNHSESFRNFWINTWNTIKSTITNVSNAIKNVTTSVWNGIKSAITSPIETAKNTVKNVIDTMKGFFNFKWELPKIKLPHFKVTGSANPLDWFSQGVPKLSVEWYAKGGILEKPTIFGANGPNLMVGGEAGPEAVAPIDALLDYVRVAVNESNSGMYETLRNMILLMSEYFPQFANMKIVLNNGVLVGELIDDIDDGLGDKKRRKGR